MMIRTYNVHTYNAFYGNHWLLTPHKGDVTIREKRDHRKGKKAGGEKFLLGKVPWGMYDIKLYDSVLKKPTQCVPGFRFWGSGYP